MKTFYTILGIIVVLAIIYIVFTYRVKIIGENPKTYQRIVFANKAGLRKSCLDCVRKHIGQAIALLGEAQLGYPEHFWIAIGHLAEAEAESEKDYPKLAEEIREARLSIIEKEDVDLTQFFKKISAGETS